MNWPVTNIGKLCVPTGQRDPTASPDSSFRYIDIASVDKDAKRITAALEMRGADAPSRARKEVRAGDVLVSTVRPNLNAVALVPDDLDGQIASTGFCVLRADQKVADGKFIFYRCLTPEFVNSLVSQMRGANYPAVSDGVVKRAEIPFPAPREQRRIVELLEQADGLRRQRAEADQLADRILPALFHKMFGDPATNPKGLPTVEFEEACSDITAGQSKTQRQKYQSEGRIPIIDQGQSVVAGYTDDDKALFQGQLPVIAFGDHTRIFKFIDHAFGMGADGLRVFNANDGFNPLFIYSQLKMANIPNAGYSRHYKFLRQIRLLKPSPTIQVSFADAAEALRKNLSAQQESGKYIERIFSMMLHRAFTGELTAKWREAHLKELLAEMEQQARLLRTTRENN